MRLTTSLIVAFAAGCGGSGGGGGGGSGSGGTGPAPVVMGNAGDLGAAASYVVLAKSAISNVTGSKVTGDVGLSPAAASLITGFSLIADSSNVFSTSASVVGKVYAATYAPPTPANLTAAIGSMQAAYTDAASRAPDKTELAAGNLGGLTLAPGVYKWGTSVTIPTDVTLSGGANDTWIFQVAGDLTIDAAKSVILSGGAQAKNIWWQVAGAASMGATSAFKGTVLCQTAITLKTSASLVGRVQAQTAVALDNNVITGP